MIQLRSFVKEDYFLVAEFWKKEYKVSKRDE